MRAGRLLADAVVDPHEADEPMTGAPVTRLAGPEGRWQYTLYQSEEHPFVHALDTARRTAVCIDLHGVTDLWNATLVLRGGRLDVVDRHARVVGRIDTTTHTLIAPRPNAGRRRTEDAGTSWLPLAAPTALLLLLAVATRRRMRGDRQRRR